MNSKEQLEDALLVGAQDGRRLRPIDHVLDGSGVPLHRLAAQNGLLIGKGRWIGLLQVLADRLF